jgi:DNA-binding beta-propeller fold protein YncE
VATSVAVSPDGNEVYVTGSNNQGATFKFVTVAYTAAGKQLWATPFAVVGGDQPNKVALSPDGKTVYVGGFTGSPSNADYVTIAYDAATGSQKWAKTYNGPANGNDVAMGMTVNQTSGNVYVTGESQAAVGGYQFATVAYSPSGTKLWAQLFSDATPAADYATSIAVNSTTGVVYVSGQSGFNGTIDYATEAISSAGKKLWVRHYNGTGNGTDTAQAVAVSPATGDVFVTGLSWGGATGYDYATVGYSASGTQVWAERYARSGSGSDVATSVAVNASGSAVYVTGRSLAPNNQYDYVTVAYSATGAKHWLKTYNGPAGVNADDEAVGVAVNQSTGNVYVTGESYNNTHLGYDYATIDYSPAGATLWTSRYAASSAINNRPHALAINPVTGVVYVTGSSGNNAGEYDYATVAYAP